MSEIKTLLDDDKTVFVFDVDGVLAKLEFGKYNHYETDDDTWNINCEKGINLYDENLVVKKMQEFLSNKDKERIYVVTKVGTKKEENYKTAYLNKYYKIKSDNIFYVYDNKEKLSALNKIKNKYMDLEDKYIVFIDDTVEVLTYIMCNSNYSTVHISTFLDI